MIVRLLGTGAADGIPAFFDANRVSAHARAVGGRELRTRAAALIDGQLKLDFGPDTFAQCLRDGLDPRDWVAVLYTHSDADHFTARELQYALYPFTDNHLAPFAIYANDIVARNIHDRYADWPFEVHVTKSFEPYTVGEYLVTPIKANHSRDEDCQNLIIDDGKVAVLYATDTGWWSDETWAFLNGMKLDALVIECTNGRCNCDYWGHLNVETCIATVTRLREMGTLPADAPVVTTHHSHEGDMTYEELVAALAPHGITAGFDGYELEI